MVKDYIHIKTYRIESWPTWVHEPFEVIHNL